MRRPCVRALNGTISASISFFVFRFLVVFTAGAGFSSASSTFVCTSSVTSSAIVSLLETLTARPRAFLFNTALLGVLSSCSGSSLTSKFDNPSCDLVRFDRRRGELGSVVSACLLLPLLGLAVGEIALGAALRETRGMSAVQSVYDERLESITAPRNRLLMVAKKMAGLAADKSSKFARRACRGADSAGAH